MADLADGERVERQGQPSRDLGRDRDATAREADDDRIAQVGALERRRETAPGIDAIVEERAHTWIVGRIRTRSIVGTTDRRGRDYGSSPRPAGP